jgi:hypothetical protein
VACFEDGGGIKMRPYDIVETIVGVPTVLFSLYLLLVGYVWQSFFFYLGGLFLLGCNMMIGNVRDGWRWEKA